MPVRRYRRLADKTTAALDALLNPELPFADALRAVVYPMVHPLQKATELGRADVEEHRQKVLRFLDTTGMDANDPIVKSEGPFAARVLQLSEDERRELIWSIRCLERHLDSMPD
jgi:hypothetical protein